MKVYRIYTEEKDNLVRLAQSFFDGFTIYSACGVWLGQFESSSVIEVISDKEVTTEINDLAKYIKIVNRQECVFVTVHEIELERI